MNIRKIRNNEESYDFELEKGEKVLNIYFGGTLDLYMSLSDGKKLLPGKSRSITYDITKEDYEIFTLFESLYEEVIIGDVFGSKDRNNFTIDERLLEQYKSLVDDDKNICWISDDDSQEVEDRVIISKVDEDTYRLTFKRNDKQKESGFKNPFGISVRFRNSGSAYYPFNCIFMRLFNRLQEIDPEYHQIHIEEYQYQKKKKQKI